MSWRDRVPLKWLLVLTVTVVIAVLGAHILLSWFRLKDDDGTGVPGVRKQETAACVLMLGPSKAGKTALFYRLQGRSSVETVPSMRTNCIPLSEVVETKQRKTLLVDAAGHPRLTPERRRYTRTAIAIVCVLDASDKASIKEAADTLYDVFINDSLRDAPVLVVANKTDLPTAKSVAAVETEILRHIERLRHTRIASMEGEDTAANFLGVEAQVFSFNDVTNTVQVVQCSAKGGRIAPLREFLSSV